MSRTYTSLHYHVIFGTKDRVPFLQTSWRARLHEYRLTEVGAALVQAGVLLEG